MDDSSVPSWDQYFITMTHLVAMRSKDRSTKGGTVIVGPDKEIRSTGYNSFPRGCDDTDDSKHQRPAKYMWTEHTERNAIYNAARIGISLKGCTLYVNWMPCHDCARGIASAGIVEVVIHKDFETANSPGSSWSESQQYARDIFEETGLNIRWYEGPLCAIRPFKGGEYVNLEIK
jgi:dCMP deaminase